MKAGARLDSERRYVLGKPGRAPAAAEAVRRFLHFYGPADAGDFADWAGLAKPHAKRLWDAGRGRPRGGRSAGARLGAERGPRGSRVAAGRARASASSRPATRTCSSPNRPLLAPDAELRKRLFRPVASPGVVLSDGRLAGLWRVKAKGKKTEVTVEKLGRVARKDIEAEAERVAELRGGSALVLVVG